MNPIVSVIVPVYNSEAYLEECLNSVLKQSFKQIEVIIINDGSTDHSDAVIQEFSRRDSRIKYFKQSNQGLGFTRNRGILESTGRYILFLDSDDFLPQQSIERLVAGLEKNKSDFIVGKVIRFNSKRKYIPVRHLEFNLYKKEMTTTIQKTPWLIQDSIVCNKLWRKNFLIKNDLKFAENRYYEDLTFSLQAACKATKISIITDFVYYWRVREESNNLSITQNQMDLKNTQDRILALEENRKWLKETRQSQSVINQNELKAVLDILRLHVMKFGMVEKQSLPHWKKVIFEYIKDVPNHIFDELPKKERLLYELFYKGKDIDLCFLSLALTNQETRPIVQIKKDGFYINGLNQIYDISTYLKPSLTIKKLSANSNFLLIEGEVYHPKASTPLNGELIFKTRKELKAIKKCKVLIQASKQNQIYPFEKQFFTSKINIKEIRKLKSTEVIDVYYQLSDFSNVQIARVRYQGQKVTQPLIFYSTNLGNFSIKKRENCIFKYIKKIKRVFLGG